MLQLTNLKLLYYICIINQHINRVVFSFNVLYSETMKPLKQSTVAIFWTLIGIFIFIIGQFFIPVIRDLFMGSELFLIPMGVFCLLGLILLVLALKEKAEGKIKKFLILTGSSATGFFVFVILHNVFYALNTVVKDIFILDKLTEGLHALFFLVAVIACPIGFLIGIIGTIVLFIKKRGKS